MRILLVEDETTVARSIELILKKAGMSVYVTNFGEEGLDLAKNYEFDLLLLDLDLPDISGHEVLRLLRLAKNMTPIMILSGNAEVTSKVRGFGSGADDYVTKPFERQELLARIHAIIRRTRGYAQSVIRAGQLEANLDAKTVAVRGKLVPLTVKEYKVFELLALRKGSTITKEMFLNHLYGGIDEPELKIVDVFICKLRKKIADATGGENPIETVWGRGYVLHDVEPTKVNRSSQGQPDKEMVA